MKSYSRPAILVALALAAVTVQAASVTFNLGQSAQNFVENGLGSNAGGNGTYQLIQGGCSISGATTTCTLSGSFTGTSAGFTSGTYSFVTTYNGSTSPTLAVSEAAPNQNFFNYSAFSSSTDMVLNLTPTGGSTVSEQLVNNGAFVDSDFSFLYTGTYACSGTSLGALACDPYDVGITTGAVGQAPVLTTVTFDAPVTTSSAAPEPKYLGVTGLLLTAGVWFFRKQNI